MSSLHLNKNNMFYTKIIIDEGRLQCGHSVFTFYEKLVTIICGYNIKVLKYLGKLIH